MLLNRIFRFNLNLKDQRLKEEALLHAKSSRNVLQVALGEAMWARKEEANDGAVIV